MIRLFDGSRTATRLDDGPGGGSNSIMFGFLAPNERLPEWRRSYARVCQYQRKLFGLTSLPFLSYEAVFLYQVAVDLELIPAHSAKAPTCCRLRRLPKEALSDEHVGSYAAAFGVVLAGVKLDDDVRDSGRIANRLLRRKYRREVQQARSVLTSIAVGSVPAIEQAVADHIVLEQRFDIALDAYVQPTGQGFAQVFAGLTSDEDSELVELGRCVGKAIIAWDCAVDYESDRVRGEFNPLGSEADVQFAFEFCLLQLAKLGWMLPDESVSQNVVASVARRVRHRMNKPIPNKTKLLERWGLIRQRGYTYAGCDACEAACCLTDCCGAAEACVCCGEADCCCEGLICCWCDDWCCDTCNKKHFQSRKGKPDPSGPYAQYFGAIGEVWEDLNPSGVVFVNGAQVPAKSDSGLLIRQGATVRVVATDAFGIRVAKSDRTI